MIGSLRGKLVRSYGEQVLIDVSGVGYEVTASGAVLGQQVAPQSEIELIIYTDVRENAIQLFGFQTILEKQVFLLLKKVKGIGSRLAQTLVSAINAEGVLSAIGREDVAALTRVPGIGKKTAERVIVELREQVGELAREVGSAGILRGTAKASVGRSLPQAIEIETVSSAEGDAVLALEKLGFAGDKARRAVSLAVQRLEADGAIAADAGELLKVALARL